MCIDYNSNFVPISMKFWPTKDRNLFFPMNPVTSPIEAGSVYNRKTGWSGVNPTLIPLSILQITEE
jgi:hypothetical protein